MLLFKVLKSIYSVYFYEDIPNLPNPDSDASFTERKTHLYIKAAYYGDINTLNVAIALGVNVGAQDKHGMTPAHYAAYRGHHECLKVICETGATLNGKNNDGLTPYYYAKLSGCEECVNIIQNCVSDQKTTDDNTQHIESPTVLSGADENFEQDL